MHVVIPQLRIELVFYGAVSDFTRTVCVWPLCVISIRLLLSLLPLGIIYLLSIKSPYGFYFKIAAAQLTYTFHSPYSLALDKVSLDFIRKFGSREWLE